MNKIREPSINQSNKQEEGGEVDDSVQHVDLLYLWIIQCQVQIIHQPQASQSFNNCIHDTISHHYYQLIKKHKK